MNEEELRTALIKFSEYLEANGCRVQVGLFAGLSNGNSFTMTVGTPDDILTAMAVTWLINKDFQIKRPNDKTQGGEPLRGEASPGATGWQTGGG